ncbi:glutathione S-transferase [Labrys monachus]|uniref:Glutathione S-transferase n=1 Tax=Labrys monachus TaxID=217067 RepID=A0ABU0FHW1_9HYPH|nr:glutathione S-transferase family protein [Labrys monachus]MDQ0394066.1 glutathione S-transferase [Labrys monachus]
MKLVIANKNYSSWSMRPWLAAKAAGITFDEEMIWLRRPETAALIRVQSPNGRVPALIDGDTIVFESIAILEYLAEVAPALWPENPGERAHARSISAEMHAGFLPLRRACPMNIKRRPASIALDADVQANVERVIDLIAGCRARFGRDGAFLFGQAFSNADAMWAPVVNRLHVYDIPVPPIVRRYMDAVMATPMWREWEEAALAETEIIADIDAVA